MRLSILVSSLGLAFALCSSSAWAFLDPPYVTPANPTSHDAIVVNVYGGECDVLNIGIVPPAVSQEGSEVTVLFTGVHEGDPEWCYFSLATESFSMGTYPQGSYTLHVERRYMTVFGTWNPETLGVIPFIVSTGATPPPVQATTLNLAGLAGLLFALMVTAHLALRRKV